MSATYLFKEEVRELEKYVQENTTLSVCVDVSGYPVKISFFEDTKQISFVDESGKAVSELPEESEREAMLQFVFYDKMQIKTQEDFSISEAVFNKLKTLSKEVNRLFLNAFFEKATSLRKTFAEDFKKVKGIEKIGNSAQNWQGKEYFLALIKPADVIDSLIEIGKIEV